jgi:hypothetical protein
MAYRLFATRPTGAGAITFTWNGALQPGDVLTSDTNRFRRSGHQATVTGGGSLIEIEENRAGRIDLNFRPGDRLLFTDEPDTGSPLTVTFNPPVRRAGAQISAASEFGVREFEFVAVVSIGTARGDRSFEKICVSRTQRDGSASFVGVASDVTDDPIEWIAFDVKKKPRTRRPILSYCINQLTVVRV